jgi:uncharacterized protein YgfB (UPF0149 family)
MSEENNPLHLPAYDDVIETIAVLNLPFSASELHGQMCAYLCAGADSQGEAYLRALLENKKDKESRDALLVLFSVYSISQQQIVNFDFEFELLLPDDNEPLPSRAEAFGQWCEGFVQGLSLAGVDENQFYEEEAQEALLHIRDFAELDYESLDVEDEDESALVEVSEYTRMAVLRLHADLLANERERSDSGSTH